MAVPSDELDRPTGEQSALGSLLERAIPYERLGAVIPRDLLQFGVYGAVAVIVTGLVALILPSPYSIRSGGFFLVFANQEAGLDGVIQGLAVPAIVCGVLLLGLDVYLLMVPTSERWRWAVVGQATAGGAGGVLAVIFLALLILNLAIWIAIIAAILMAIGAVLSGG